MPPPAPAPSKRCPGTLICSDAAALGKHGERACHRKHIHTCQPRHEPRECTGSPEGRTDPDTNPTGLPGRGPGGSPHASQASFRCVEAQSPSLRTAVHDRGSPAAWRGHSGQSPPARLHFTRQVLVTALARDPLKTTGHPHHQTLTPTKRHGKAGQARPPPSSRRRPACRLGRQRRASPGRGASLLHSRTWQARVSHSHHTTPQTPDQHSATNTKLDKPQRSQRGRAAPGSQSSHVEDPAGSPSHTLPKGGTPGAASVPLGVRLHSQAGRPSPALRTAQRTDSAALTPGLCGRAQQPPRDVC